MPMTKAQMNPTRELKTNVRNVIDIIRPGNSYRFQTDRVGLYKNKTQWNCVEYKSGCKARIHTVCGELRQSGLGPRPD